MSQNSIVLIRKCLSYLEFAVMKSVNSLWIGWIDLFKFCHLSDKKRIAICQMKISRTKIFSFHDANQISSLRFQTEIK